jgi:predicted HD phosphohydrolase
MSPRARAGETVSFTRMSEGTAADFALLDRAGQPWVAGLADRLLAMLATMSDAFPGYQTTSLEHLLQSATRAERDGADEEMVAAALLHDIGDVLCPHNHSEYAAAILRPYVRPETHWVIRHHGIFQLYHYHHLPAEKRELRQRYRDSPHWQACVDFCARWDQVSFDPDYDMLPLEHFAPMLRRVLARPPFDPAITGAGGPAQAY